MNEIDLTKGNINKTLVRFAIPFLLALLLQALYGAADLLIVGQFADSVQQSAVATGTQVMNLITNLIVGLSTGATVIIGHYMGEGRRDQVQKTIGTSFVVFIVIAVIFTVIFTLCSGPITQLMNSPAESREYTQGYIFICSCGIFFIFGYNAIAAILRGMGDSKSPLFFVLIACVTNIILDIILVNAGMGAAGAAVATISAQGLSMVISIIYLKKKNFIFDFKPASFRTTKDKVSKLLKTGVPIAFQNIIVNISFLIITSICNTFGVAASAAMGINEKFNMFFMLPAMAFSLAISTFVAQNMGARRPDRSKKALRLGMLISLAFAVVFFLLLRFIPDILCGVFTHDPDVIYQAELYISSFSYDILLVAVVFCLNGFINGAGKPTTTLISNLISTFAVRVPMTLIFSSLPGATLYEIGWAAPIATVIQIIIIFCYYKSNRWDPEYKLRKQAGL